MCTTTSASDASAAGPELPVGADGPTAPAEAPDGDADAGGPLVETLGVIVPAADVGEDPANGKSSAVIVDAPLSR